MTIGAVLGMAAHLEGKGCGMIDMAGLAQKGGAVFSHLRIAEVARRHPCDPRIGRQGRPGARLRPRRLRRQESARRGQAEPHDLRRQHGRDHARRLCPLGRFLAAGGAAEEGDPRGGRRRARAFRRRDADCGCAVRQFARRQHVHARLCLPAWRPAAVLGGGREGDRAQRTSRGDERRRIPLGPARRPRAGFRARIDWRAGRAWRPSDGSNARRDRGASGRVPDRLSEPALRPPL